MSIVSLPTPTTSAMAEPDMPEKISDDTTFTWPMPPRKRPTSALHQASSRSLSEPMFMISAARMNSGIASSV